MITILFSCMLCLPEQPTSFKTGKQLQAAMAADIKWSSIGVQLDSQLEDLQQQCDVAILRDRRIDPHQVIGVETEFVPRVQVLRQISDEIPDTEVCVGESFIFFGPTMAAARLPILLSRNAEQVNSLRKRIDTRALQRLTTKVDVSWDDLAEPRQMLVDQATSAGSVILNPNVIPHDVWAKRRLPKMSFIELATVVLNQFDLTIKISQNATEFTVDSIDPDELFEHRYLVGKFKPAVAEAWQSQLPDVEIKWNGSNATITTSLLNHARLNAILQEVMFAPTQASKPSNTKGSLLTTDYQLKAERATLGQLIREFRAGKITIEVVGENSYAVQAIMKESIPLGGFSEKRPGTKFFPLLFGKHFKRVEVKSDRVVLSLD